MKLDIVVIIIIIVFTFFDRKIDKAIIKTRLYIVGTNILLFSNINNFIFLYIIYYRAYIEY